MDPIVYAFERRLRRPDDTMAVSGSRRASVADVDRMSRVAADRLTEARIGDCSLVVLAAPNGPGFLAGLLAIRRHRCAAVLCDGRAPEAEKARIAEALGVAAVLDCRCAWPQGPGDFALTPAVGERASLSPEIAVVKLTSGSTGRPRGILTSSAALIADDAGLAATMGLAADERILAVVPMSHSYGLSSVAMPVLMRRSLLVVADPGGPLDPLAPARAHDATFLPTVPAFLQALVRMAEPPRAPRSLRLVISAGAPLRVTTAAAFRDIYGQPVHVFYGASECGGIAFDRTGTAGERGTLGTPVEGVVVTLAPVAGAATGEGGTVVVDSPAVASGYCPDADPSLADGRFHTRDLAVFRYGELVLDGRLDDLINVRGKKVNPREVETVLARLDGVDDVVTLGVPLPGRDETVVRAFIACRPGKLTHAAVQAWCRRHLTSHKIPRGIVLLDEIPRTERGKLDRAALLAARSTSGHG